MQWYTLEDGRVCLGTEETQYANFHSATDVKLEQKVTSPLLEEHINLIGSYPEDWYSDDSIDQKINQTAKHLFGHFDNIYTKAIV